jgi:hypothetical protein
VIREESQHVASLFAQTLHSLPKTDRFLWVETGKGHQKNADMVSLRLLFAIIAKLFQHPDEAGTLVGNPFACVMGQNVSDFMGQDRGQLVIVLDNLQDPREYEDLAAGECESIDLVRANDVESPFVPVAFDMEINLPLQRLDLGCANDSASDAARPLNFRLVCRQDPAAIFPQEFLGGLLA